MATVFNSNGKEACEREKANGKSQHYLHRSGRKGPENEVLYMVWRQEAQGPQHCQNQPKHT